MCIVQVILSDFFHRRTAVYSNSFYPVITLPIQVLYSCYPNSLLPGNLVTGPYSLSARAPCFYFIKIAKATLTLQAGIFFNPYESAPLSQIIIFFSDFLATFAWHFDSKFGWIYRLPLSASTFSLILKGFNIGHSFLQKRIKMTKGFEPIQIC